MPEYEHKLKYYYRRHKLKDVKRQESKQGNPWQRAAPLVCFDAGALVRFFDCHFPPAVVTH